MDDKETNIGRIAGSKVASISSSELKVVNYMKKLAEKYPDDVKNVVVNSDGSIYANIPADWFPMPRPPKKMNLSDEEKEIRAERMRKARESK